MIMIHISKLFQVVENHSEFSICWVKENGVKVFAPRAACTSFHSSGTTMNIKLLDSGQIRKVNRMSVIEFNGEEIVL